MNDFARALAPKSDQLNSDDLITGPRDITVTRVTIAGAEQPVSVFFEGDDGKPFKPCKSMTRVLVNAWGTVKEEWTGRSMRLWRDPTVTYGGMAVGGIRISHLSHISSDLVMALTATKQTRKMFTAKPMPAAQGASRTAAAPASASDDLLTRDAKGAANQGTAAFTKFWNDPKVKPHRGLLTSKLDDLKKLASEADERAVRTMHPEPEGPDLVDDEAGEDRQEDVDVFGLPRLSQAEVEQARADFEAERARELAGEGDAT